MVDRDRQYTIAKSSKTTRWPGVICQGQINEAHLFYLPTDACLNEKGKMEKHVFLGVNPTLLSLFKTG